MDMMVEPYIEKLYPIFTAQKGLLASGESGCVIDRKIFLDNINAIFKDSTCVDMIYTENSDKLFFGVYVNPTITPDDLMAILFGDEDFKINRYSVEIDSKLFNIGLEAEEIVAYILYEISSMICSSAPIFTVRALIDKYLTQEDEVINIKNSAGFAQVLILAVKDAIIKVTSVRYKDTDGILSNKFINSDEILRDSLISGLNKIRSSAFGVGTVVKEPDLTLLQWAFMVYNDPKLYVSRAINTLTMSKNYTASKLQIGEIDRTIKSLQRVNLDIVDESARIINEAKKKGFFAGLKANGLRSLEDDLYEYSIRAKNAENEDEAFYALRQINTRLNVLEEYIYENEGELSETEIARWRAVANKYRELRDILSKKKLKQKQYGLWFDYDKLDELDD